MNKPKNTKEIEIDFVEIRKNLTKNLRTIYTVESESGTIKEIFDKVNNFYEFNLDDATFNRQFNIETTGNIIYLFLICNLYGISLDALIFGKIEKEMIIENPNAVHFPTMPKLTVAEKLNLLRKQSIYKEAKEFASRITSIDKFEDTTYRRWVRKEKPCFPHFNHFVALCKFYDVKAENLISN